MATSPRLPFRSHRASAFDEIVARSEANILRPSDALAIVRRWERDNSAESPAIYVSTAVTSAGYARFNWPIRDVIDANNRSASRLMRDLIRSGQPPGFSPVITGDNAMIPTELGKVERWKDADYILFYFAYARGLTLRAARRLEEIVKADENDEILYIANDRALPRERRWPAYEAFTEITLDALDSLERVRSNRARSPMTHLLQLVDVERSLGCRAETMFAHHFDLTFIKPTIDLGAPKVKSDLREDVERLRSRRASVGVTPRPVGALYMRSIRPPLPDA